MKLNQKLKTFHPAKIISLTVVSFLMSCQPGEPLVKVLGQVSGFEVDQSMMTIKSKTSKEVFYITGKCFSSISEVQVSFDGGTSFSSLNQYASESNFNCASTGSYSFKIDPSSTAIFDIPSQQNFKDFWIRGMSDFGPTGLKVIRRQLTSGEALITAGSMVQTGTTASGTAYIFKGRIQPTATIVTGPNFILKASVKIK